MAQLVTSKPSDGSVGAGLNLVEVPRSVIFSHITPRSAGRLCRGYTYSDFTVDEGNGPLDPSRDKK